MLSIFPRLSRRIAQAFALGLAALTLISMSAHAQTLDEIKARGRMLVGIQGDNPPFGFLDTQGRNDGYDADVARALGAELHVPVEFVIVTNQNRIAALQTGRVDILLSTLAMNADRAKALQFSKPYAANQMSLVAAKSSKLDGPAALKGVTVGVPKGSAQESQLVKIAPDAELRRFDDDSSNIQALLSGQVQAVGANQFYIGRIEKLKPNAYENKFPLTVLYNGAGTRLGDKQWNTTVNNFLDKMKEDNRLATLYKKWFGLPLPTFPNSLEGVAFTSQ